MSTRAYTLVPTRRSSDVGLILVCAGAGGHAGTISPFALLPVVRRFYKGTIIFAGAISDGRAIAAARVLAADMVYVGTRFIATRESAASDDYKEMLLAGTSSDVVYTSAISGVSGNFLRASIIERGLDPENLTPPSDGFKPAVIRAERSEEHTSELQSLMRTSYAVFCLKKK